MSPLSVTPPVTEPANAPLLHFVDWVNQYVHGEERAEAQIMKVVVLPRHRRYSART